MSPLPREELMVLFALLALCLLALTALARISNRLHLSLRDRLPLWTLQLILWLIWLPFVARAIIRQPALLYIESSDDYWLLVFILLGASIVDLVTSCDWDFTDTLLRRAHAKYHELRDGVVEEDDQDVARQGTPRKDVPIDKKFLPAINTDLYLTTGSPLRTDPEDTECMHCREDITPHQQTLTHKPCKFSWHKDCLTDWIKRQVEDGKTPICPYLEENVEDAENWEHNAEEIQEEDEEEFVDAVQYQTELEIKLDVQEDAKSKLGGGRVGVGSE